MDCLDTIREEGEKGVEEVVLERNIGTYLLLLLYIDDMNLKTGKAKPLDSPNEFNCRVARTKFASSEASHTLA
jgi:hypothetical protein